MVKLEDATTSKYEIPVFERPNPGRDMLMCLCIVIKGRLDVDLLKSSFVKLVVQWPKLGSYLECPNIKVRSAYSRIDPQNIY